MCKSVVIDNEILKYSTPTSSDYLTLNPDYSIAWFLDVWSYTYVCMYIYIYVIYVFIFTYYSTY